MAEQTVELDPGESREISFEATPTEARTYQVSVDGLTGSFTALTAPVVEITAITLDKTKILGGEDFTISITFSNPHDYDVWVRPGFAFGQLNTEFVAERILYGWDPTIIGGPWDPGCIFDWVDLGGQPSGNLLPEAYGSNMTPYLYDPDGAALTSGEHAYLRVPAKGKATTSLKWYAGRPEEYGKRDVCVKVESAFNLIYYPEGIGIIRYGLPEAIGNVRHYEKVGYAYVPFTGVASGIAAFGTPPGAVSIDTLEVEIPGSSPHTRVTITNNTSRTFRDQSTHRGQLGEYTRFSITAYAREDYTLPARGRSAAKLVKAGDKIGYLFSTTQTDGIGNTPPGTTVKTFLRVSAYQSAFSCGTYVGEDGIGHSRPVSDCLPEGRKGYVHVYFKAGNDATEVVYAESEAGFKGIFSSEWQRWTRIPFRVDKIKDYYIPWISDWIYKYIFVEL